jgi:hypothetical protein
VTKDDFDIQVEMAVYTAAGEKIGTVSPDAPKKRWWKGGGNDGKTHS